MNPFDKPAAEAQGKNYFGTLSLLTNKVNLVSGASYAVPGLTYANGNIYEFKGKMKDPKGAHTHVIVCIKAHKADGGEYTAFRDFMYWQKDPCQKVTMPSLRQFFGAKLGNIWGKTAEVRAEAVEVDDGSYTKQAFKILEVYPDAEKRQEAEEKFFSRFQTGAEIADEIPGFEDEPMPWEDDQEVGMEKEQALALLPTLWTASKQNAEAFLKQLEGMPVVVDALGGLDAPEILALINEE